jgi:hypothetical protein
MPDGETPSGAQRSQDEEHDAHGLSSGQRTGDAGPLSGSGPLQIEREQPGQDVVVRDGSLVGIIAKVRGPDGAFSWKWAG